MVVPLVREQSVEAMGSMASEDCADDIRKISHAMDVLAKLVLEQRKDGGSLQLEYQRKIDALDKLISTILRTSKENGPEGDWQVDKVQLAASLRDGVEIMERPDELLGCSRKYVLVPVSDPAKAMSKSNRKKKNRIACSFCNEVGHTRAKCAKRLVHVPQNGS